MKEKLLKEQNKKKKKDFLEVYLVKKFVYIKDYKFIFLNGDGIQKIVFLKGCFVEVVLGFEFLIRKWYLNFLNFVNLFK